jgi:arginase
MARIDAGRIAIVGAGLDLGQERRGVDMGPSAIRYGGLQARLEALGYSVRDAGDIIADPLEALDVGDEHAKYLGPILRYGVRIAELVEQTCASGELPVVLGGDHSVAIGVLGGLAHMHGAPGGVLWIDAHADMNTPESSPTGNVHGMPLAAALGLGGAAFESPAWPTPTIEAAHTALVGIRSLDEAERRTVRAAGVRVVTTAEVDRIGMEAAARVAIERLRGAAWVHVSLDLDVVDPLVAPGVGTPVPGGISYREAHLLMEMIHESGLVGSLQVVEVNPILDRENQTGALAVELICSALGQRIY